MRRYHHLEIPTESPRAGEIYLSHLKMYVSGYEASEYGVEWIRFDDDCPLPHLVRTVPHVAFEVDDLDAVLEGKHVLIEPNGAPIEFLQKGSVAGAA